MSTTLPPTAVALAVCALLTGALLAIGTATSPERVADAPTPRDRGRSADRAGGGRVAAGLAVGVLVLLATRWVVLAALATGLVVVWGRLLHDRAADRERERIEGIAKWLEDLRDTLRGSSVGAEEALEQVALRPPASIAQALLTFVHRRRQGFRTDDALLDLADDLAHPTSDAAIAAIRLVVGGAAGAGRLHPTVQALAAAARDEVAARERVDRTRLVYQRSMQRLVLIGAGLVGYLRLAGGDLLDPYGTAVGQVVLLIPLGMWLGCVLWLRSLCRYELPARNRIARTGGPEAREVAR